MAGVTASAGQRALKAYRICFPLALVLWIILVLYPNPLKPVVSLHRLISPEVDPAAARSLADGLPSDPVEIERAVLQRLPYCYDWESWSVPWYYPTVGEALEKGRADCKGRAIVLASVLEVKGIPYQINSSPTHVWVDYPGKQENSAENPDVGLYGVDPQTGKRSYHFPHINVMGSIRLFWDGFWAPMPVVRMVLLIAGPLILVAGRVLWPRRQKPPAPKDSGSSSGASAPAASR